MAVTTREDAKPEATAPKRSHVLRNVLLAAVVFVVLALALGLGLGLGLKKHKNSAASSSSSSSSSSSPSGPSGASQTIQPWRRSTQDYALDMTSWDINAAPTTRVYNLTVSELTLAPDGMRPPVL
jgi:hypothetical protein